MKKDYVKEASVLLTELMDELMLSSPFSPDLTSKFRNELLNKLINNIIMADVAYKPIAETLYGFNDNQSYTIAAFSSEQIGYLHVLFPASSFTPYGLPKELIASFRETNPKVTGEEIKAVADKAGFMYQLVKEVLRTSTRSTRLALNKTQEDFVLPSPEELERFYKCGRKHAYQTREEAEENLQEGEHAYNCSYCSFYHKGHPMTGQNIPAEIAFKRWETAYRRKNKI